ncbi:GumC family protein [Cesiribacter andamanensis]|uniref:Putative tyrosine-protein kinase in cps region n=1 Tax=Cesiribacter andamanensis AMV16 TaxID=1279009 RepID=M7NL99_9BACT|nr:polysaccharide biosynthesis tyrosine autokinase [Cesiribacter andamanensis]EMR02570.1 Putative tyrosine-protein kinase in cps region [Cesiribacter andamanensis AMV16]
MEPTKNPESSENILESLWYKFFPFWPLLLLLCTLFLALGIGYSLYRKPTFTVAASLIINTNNEGNQGYSNQPFRALNAFATTQVVDNEVMVLQSRSLMKEVVLALHLYAPIGEKRTTASHAGFLNSPLLVEAQNPEEIKKTEGKAFSYEAGSKRVVVEGKPYALHQWIEFPYGTLRFVPNPYQQQPAQKPLYFALEHPSIVARQLTNNLGVSTTSKLSTTINLTYQTEQPDMGEAVLNELLRQYLRTSVANENALAANSLEFVEERLREVEWELDSIERRVQQFRTRTGAINLSEQGRIYLQNVAENDRRVAEIEAQLALLDQVARYLSEEGSRTGVVPSTLGIDDPVLANLLQQLNQLELQLARERTTTGENNPLVRSIENEIQQIRPNIQSIVTNQQARLRASRNRLTATSGRITATIRDIPEQERELLDISRQQAVKRDLYAFLLQRREEAALSNSSSLADGRVVDWADANVANQGSRRLLILLGCLVAAFGAGIGYVLVRENLSGALLFRSDIEKHTAHPVLAEITYRKPTRKAPDLKAPDPVLVREFGHLQAAMGLFHAADTGKTILVTAFLQQEGSSFVASQLALQLARTGKRVVLLDLNLQRPALSAAYGLQQAKGFTDFFQSEEVTIPQLVQASGEPGLDVLPAGSPTQRGVALLTHPRMEELLALLRSQYTYILMDTAALELASDALALAPFADHTLLVLRHGVTPKTLLKRLDTASELKTLRNVGLVLNGIKARGFPRRYFGYGFGYGYERVIKQPLRP